jgi:hypothetical protein
VGREQAALLMGSSLLDMGLPNMPFGAWASLLDMGLPNMLFGAWASLHWRANKRNRADKACAQCSNRLKWQT